MDKTNLPEARLRARKSLDRAGKLDFKPVSSAKWVDVERSWTGKIYVRIKRHLAPLTGSHNKGFATHEKSRITEQFNDHHKKIEVDVYTERLDDEEFNFSIKKFGFTAVHLNHFYSAEGDGSRCYAENVVGLDVPLLGWLFNWVILPFIYSKRTAEHWIRHNVEETGRGGVGREAALQFAKWRAKIVLGSRDPPPHELHPDDAVREMKSAALAAAH
ncbi:hypothetical protein V499_03614 [Pseudogymnoascus sp. VKM F-103]|nr:hypothetical protein V499_03614 [Pseudogymnoascus sp. VKM F-103]